MPIAGAVIVQFREKENSSKVEEINAANKGTMISRFGTCAILEHQNQYRITVVDSKPTAFHPNPNHDFPIPPKPHSRPCSHDSTS